MENLNIKIGIYCYFSNGLDDNLHQFQRTSFFAPPGIIEVGGTSDKFMPGVKYVSFWQIQDLPRNQANRTLRCTKLEENRPILFPNETTPILTCVIGPTTWVNENKPGKLSVPMRLDEWSYIFSLQDGMMMFLHFAFKVSYLLPCKNKRVWPLHITMLSHHTSHL